jgi:hypothetical protein
MMLFRAHVIDRLLLLNARSDRTYILPLLASVNRGLNHRLFCLI